MGEEVVTCQFYNSGFCKFKSNCKKFHYKETCSLQNCKQKLCHKRHPKKCRYSTDCARGTECLYKHNSIVNGVKEIKLQQGKIQEENRYLKSEIILLKENIEKTKKSLEKEKENTKEIKQLNIKHTEMIDRLNIEVTSLKKALTKGLSDFQNKLNEKDEVFINLKKLLTKSELSTTNTPPQNVFQRLKNVTNSSLNQNKTEVEAAPKSSGKENANESYKCAKCNLTFQSENNVWQHNLMTHWISTGDNKYKFKLCTTIFKNRDDRTTHIKVVCSKDHN